MQSTTEISIHALREEGDTIVFSRCRLSPTFLSTPSVRRATKQIAAALEIPSISIHALREEGDLPSRSMRGQSAEFLSTPSVRRATLSVHLAMLAADKFLSTPSVRRATKRHDDL